MAIITEEMLRNKRLSKQLANGQLLVLPIGSFLTPAAKSYLRENRIHWSLADVQTIKKKNGRCRSCLSFVIYTIFSTFHF